MEERDREREREGHIDRKTVTEKQRQGEKEGYILPADERNGVLQMDVPNDGLLAVLLDHLKKKKTRAFICAPAK